MDYAELSNGQRLVTMLCSPFQVDALVVGHLWMERIIARVDEITRLEISEMDGRIELIRPFVPSTAGTPKPEPPRSSIRVTPDVLSAPIADLAKAGEGLLIATEDVARRNALDKVKGRALLDGVPTVDRVLVSSGRISSEMLLRTARMGVPLVASRTSPTDMAISLAEELDITVCGSVRPDSLNLYAGGAPLLEKAPVPANPAEDAR